jgi:phosphoserine phosphatase RsbU/P
MSIIHTLEALPGIISQLTSDLAESVDCAWAVVVSRIGMNLLPLYTYGNPPCLDGCLESLTDPKASGAYTASIVCPIRIDGENLVVLAFGPKTGAEPYTSSDRDLIAGLAAHISTLLSDDRLAATVARNFARLRKNKTDLEGLRDVQRRFLPGRLRPIRGLDYYGECTDGSEVGRDFFDFVPQGPASLLLSIGDVSAKDIAAAMIMAGLQASLRAFGLTNRSRISSMVRDLNRMVCQLSPDRLYATMFYARIDTARRELRYVNAGHEPPLLIRHKDSGARELGSTGTVLGLSARTAYGERTVGLEAGDVFVAMSEECGVPRQLVLDVVREYPGASSSALAGHILRAVDDSAPGADKAVIVARFIGSAALELVADPPLRRHALARASMAG